MQFGLKEFLKLQIVTRDGKHFKLRDVLFDQDSWKMQYLVLDTSSWLPAHKVVVSTGSAHLRLDGDGQMLELTLNSRQIEEAPELADDLPVSRQYEVLLHQYYGWTPYWLASLEANAPFLPDQNITLASNHAHGDAFAYPLAGVQEALLEESHTNFLLSAGNLKGYYISSKDDELFGELYDLTFESRSWSIMSIILDTNRWLPGGRKVVYSPGQVSSIDIYNRTVHINSRKGDLYLLPTLHRDLPEYKKTAHF